MGLYKYDSTEDKLKLVAGSTNFSDAPVGAIFPFGGTDIPISFLLCDGSAVSRTDYEDLFNVIGTAFGTGDGSTTFNLPDLREAVPKGAGLTGYTVGNHVKSGGLAVGEFLDDRIQDHTHELTLSPNMSFLTGEGNYKTVPVSAGSIQTGVVPSAYRNGATTEVKSVGVNYIIKAKMIAVPADFMSAVDEAVEEKLTVETITGTGTTGLGFTAKKSGNVVTVYLYCTADVSDGQSISFGVLPTGYRPPKNVKFLIHSNNGSLDPTQGMFVDISSYNGGIASYSYVALTSGQCGAITYIVD